MKNVTTTTILIAALAIAGCKASKFSSSNSSTKSDSIVLPRFEEKASPKTTAASALLPLTEYGTPKLSMVLGLDYFPKGNDKQSLPKCYGAFPSGTELGIVMCLDGTKKNVPVFSDHVIQDCYTRQGFQRIVASRSFRFQGCRKGAILMHRFSRELRIDVESRD